MNNLPNSSYEVSSIGEGARGWLSPGQRGEVLAVVSRAVYLLTEESELVWLIGEPGPMHRRGLKLSSSLPRLAIGSTFDVQGEILVTSSGDALDFSHSTVWKTPLLSSGKVVTYVRLPELLLVQGEIILGGGNPANDRASIVRPGTRPGRHAFLGSLAGDRRDCSGLPGA